MDIYQRFTAYTPDVHPVLDALRSGGGYTDVMPGSIVFLQSETGEDWYSLQASLPGDKLKFICDEEGWIRDINLQASGLWPAGMSLVLASEDELPPAMREDLAEGDNRVRQRWSLIDGEIVPRPRYYERIRASRAREARLHLVEIQAEMLADDTASERGGALNAWLSYLHELRVIDPADGPDIVWPPAPDTSI